MIWKMPCNNLYIPVHIQTNWWPCEIQWNDKLFQGQLIANFRSWSVCDIIFDMFPIFKRDMSELLLWIFHILCVWFLCSPLEEITKWRLFLLIETHSTPLWTTKTCDTTLGPFAKRIKKYTVLEGSFSKIWNLLVKLWKPFLWSF